MIRHGPQDSRSGSTMMLLSEDSRLKFEQMVRRALAHLIKSSLYYSKLLRGINNSIYSSINPAQIQSSKPFSPEQLIQII